MWWLCYDALAREESCGAHFRLEHQLADGEAKRDDEHFAYVACWEYKGTGELPVLHKEPLTFDNVHLAIRSLAKSAGEKRGIKVVVHIVSGEEIA